MGTTANGHWTKIRWQRSEPPGAASDDVERRTIFTAAVQQAEQLFDAAAATPVHSRPIPLYYGLNQAARAIVAAHGTEARFSSHGIRADNLAGGLLGATLRDSKTGGLRALASVVGSPTLGDQPVPIWALGAAIPAFVHVHHPETGHPSPLLLWPEPMDDGAVFHMSRIASGWLHGFPVALFGDGDDEREIITRVLRSYPTVQGWRFIADAPHGVPRLQDRDLLRFRLQWTADQGTEADRQMRLWRAGVRVFGSDTIWVPPLVGSGTEVLAPIVTWWAFLFGLSMLARYEPAAWVSALDLNTSRLAVPLESLLDAALSEVPALILGTLEDPRHWQP